MKVQPPTVALPSPLQLRRKDSDLAALFHTSSRQASSAGGRRPNLARQLRLARRVLVPRALSSLGLFSAVLRFLAPARQAGSALAVLGALD